MVLCEKNGYTFLIDTSFNDVPVDYAYDEQKKLLMIFSEDRDCYVLFKGIFQDDGTLECYWGIDVNVCINGQNIALFRRVD